MGQGLRLNGLRVFTVIALVAGIPATVFAHARLVQPKPRTDNPGGKAGPCDGVPRTTMYTQYDAGATITVKWQETIDHSGCFDIDFSPADDKNWVRLKRIQDDAGTAPDAMYTTTVQLPQGVTCPNCTLALRQIMVSSAAGQQLGAVCNQNTPDEMDGGPPTYFSCADIRIGDFPDAGGTPMEAGTDEEDSGSSSGGPTTTPTDGGGKTVPEGSSGSNGAPRKLGSDDSGCSVGFGATSGLTFAVAAGFLGLALARRRRRR